MKHVVIIGAGPAGITAAYELLKRSEEYRVTILESSGEIGGISRTICHNGNRMDIGGHRFFSKNKRVTDWWGSILPLQGAPASDDLVLKREKEYAEHGPDPEKEDRVMLLRDRWSRIYYKGSFFDYPVKMNRNTLRNIGVGGTVKAGLSYLGACVHKLPEDNLENFYINRFGRVLYQMFFEGYTEKLWGRHPRDISADWGAQRVKGLSVAAVIEDIISKIIPRKDYQVETSLIERFHYPKYGPGQLWELAALEVEKMGGEIHMNSTVTGIEGGDFSVRGVLYTDAAGEHSIYGDYVISSMPMKDLTCALGDAVPPEIAKIAEGLPYRDFVTVGLLLKRMNLRNETKYRTIGGIVPDCWIYVQEPSVQVGRIQIFNNWSPYMVKDLRDTVWVGLEYFCDEGDALWNMDDSKCIEFAVMEMMKMGIIDSPEDVLDSHRERVKKAYPAYFDTYCDISKLREYLDTWTNLFCVGRNGQHRYNNMDHSMLTAINAADLILSGSTDKSKVWDVNTGGEYQETIREER